MRQVFSFGAAGRVSLLYMLFGFAWIILSDRILFFFVSDARLLTVAQTYKGWLFVVLSAVLIFALLGQELARQEQLARRTQASEARYRELLQHAADGIFVLDPQGVTVEVNESASRMLGAPPDVLLGRPLGDMLEPHASLADLLGAEDPSSGPALFESQLRAGSGLLPVEINARQLAGGQIQAIVRDISERLLAEKQIRRQLQRLDSLYKIDLAITNTLDLHTMLQVLIDQTILQLKVEAAAVLLYNPDSHMLEHAQSRGFGTPAILAPLKPGAGLAGMTFLGRRSLWIDDLDATPHVFLRRSLMTDEGFRSYAGVPLVAKGEVKGVLEVFCRGGLPQHADWRSFLETLAGQAAIAIDNMTLYTDLQRFSLELALAYDATLEGWSRALELRDRETQGHSQRVTGLTMQLTRQLGFNENDLIHVRRGTLLHDIGKMAIPDQILLKPGPLDPGEWEEMRRHPQYAFEMLANISFLRPALDIPYCHHERWDGAGYPRGLAGEQIPLAARAFAVVDVWDALSSDRPYRNAWPSRQVRRYILANAGKHFDPSVVNTFLNMV